MGQKSNLLMEKKNHLDRDDTNNVTIQIMSQDTSKELKKEQDGHRGEEAAVKELDEEGIYAQSLHSWNNSILTLVRPLGERHREAWYRYRLRRYRI